MEPATTIIGKLGGPTAVAQHLGLHRTRVSNWQRPKQVGGTGGTIPQRHIPALIRLAESKGIALQHSDFFDESLAKMAERRKEGAAA